MYIKFYMNLALTVILGIAPFIALTFFNIKIYLRYVSVSRHCQNSKLSTKFREIPNYVFILQISSVMPLLAFFDILTGTEIG